MFRPRRAAVLAVTVSVLAIGSYGAAQAGQNAQAGQKAQADPVVHDLATTEAEQQAVLDYWTAERIEDMPTGPSTPGHPPEDGPDGAGFPTGTAVDGTVGRLFFVDRGEDSSCTATLVESDKRSTVVTAGHCVHGMDLAGNEPQWTGKALFVPGFRDGERPFGSYAVRASVASAEWVADDQREEHDQAFMVLNPGEDGREAADATGAVQRIGIGEPGDRAVHEFGYPRAAEQEGHQGRPEFTGQRVARCWGSAKENPGTPELPVEKGHWGVACDMGGGASGGPRLSGFDEKTGKGTVVGVNTMSGHLRDDGSACSDGEAPECTRYLFGPQFTGPLTQPLYDRASSL